MSRCCNRSSDAADAFLQGKYIASFIGGFSSVFFSGLALSLGYFFAIFTLTFFDLCVVDFWIDFVGFPLLGEVQGKLQR